MKMKMAAIAGGLGMISYMYLRKHPEKVLMFKEIGKEASRIMYNKLDSN